MSDLRSFMKDRLPGFMVPSAYVILDKMPLTPNQKIDRRALPAPDAKDMEDGDYVAPRNAVEEMLAEIWAKTLRLDRVSVHATFFELGGHSLSAAQMMTKIREAFNVDVPLSLLFESPSVEGLGAAIEALATSDPATYPPRSLWGCAGRRAVAATTPSSSPRHPRTVVIASSWQRRSATTIARWL